MPAVAGGLKRRVEVVHGLGNPRLDADAFPHIIPIPVEQQLRQEAAHSAIAIIEGVVLHILEMPAVGEAGGPHQVAVQPQDIVKRVQKVPSPRSEAKGRLSRRGPRRRAENGCRPSQPPTFSNAHRVGLSESSRRRHTSPTHVRAPSGQAARARRERQARQEQRERRKRKAPPKWRALRRVSSSSLSLSSIIMVLLDEKSRNRTDGARTASPTAHECRRCAMAYGGVWGS